MITMGKGILFFLCGKMGAGKSTVSKRLELEEHAVRLSEDEWLQALYPNQIHTFEDYRRHSELLKPIVETTVQRMLEVGTNVVMDFPANTIGLRQWFLAIANKVGADHQLIYLNLSDEQCMRRIAKRRTEMPERAAFDTKEVFDHVTSFFEAPSESEGIRIIEYD
ncbi:ATP-binding protein [Exiguobacterium chiriqhucha]|uniref:AAA family ATPase n=1 Tax=Exiguobacterium chiriqhucha TaxID=1385984 RepID=UPI0030B855AC